VGTGSFLNSVSSSVIPIRSKKKIIAVTNNMELNLLSHQRFIKKDITNIALSEAIPIATITFQGLGI
jgi:hypothetical protein